MKKRTINAWNVNSFSFYCSGNSLKSKSWCKSPKPISSFNCSTENKKKGRQRDWLISTFSVQHWWFINFVHSPLIGHISVEMMIIMRLKHSPFTILCSLRPYWETIFQAKSQTIVREREVGEKEKEMSPFDIEYDGRFCWTNAKSR